MPMRKAKFIAGLVTTAALATAGPAAANILPVATWPLNEGSGTVVHDTSFHGNTGTLQGSGATWSAGRFGKDLAFNGTSGDVNVPNDPTLQPANQITVTTSKQVVQLSGFVDSDAHKAEAESVARGVQGVTDVHNNIIVQ